MQNEKGVLTSTTGKNVSRLVEAKYGPVWKISLYTPVSSAVPGGKIFEHRPSSSVFLPNSQLNYSIFATRVLPRSGS